MSVRRYTDPDDTQVQCAVRSPRAATAAATKGGCQDTSTTASQSRSRTVSYAVAVLRSAAMNSIPSAGAPASPRARHVTAMPRSRACVAISRPSHWVPPRTSRFVTAPSLGGRARSVGRHVVASTPPVSLRNAVRMWGYIGLNSFGGPAGQISVMHRELVERRRWLSEERFLHALNYCMVLPGPEAQQLATYVGWLMNGVRGGAIAGTLFIIPGFVVMMALSIAYALYGEVTWVAGLLAGLQAAVVALVVEAMIRVGRRSLHSPLPAPSGGWRVRGDRRLPRAVSGRHHRRGAAGMDRRADAVRLDSLHRPSLDHGHVGRASLPSGRRRDGHCRSSSAGSAGRGRLPLAVALAPRPAARPAGPPTASSLRRGCCSPRQRSSRSAAPTRCWRTSSQQAVQAYGWITPSDMVTGLGLAETTPGPLIMVVQFRRVPRGLQQPREPASTGRRNPGRHAHGVGDVPAVLLLHLHRRSVCRATATQRRAAPRPCGHRRGRRRSDPQPRAVFFALNTAFARVDVEQWGPIHLNVPDLSSVRWTSVAITGLGRAAHLPAAYADSRRARGVRCSGLRRGGHRPVMPTAPPARVPGGAVETIGCYASALAFSFSNSLWSMAPESSRDFAAAI